MLQRLTRQFLQPIYPIAISSCLSNTNTNISPQVTLSLTSPLALPPNPSIKGCPRSNIYLTSLPLLDIPFPFTPLTLYLHLTHPVNLNTQHDFRSSSIIIVVVRRSSSSFVIAVNGNHMRSSPTSARGADDMSLPLTSHSPTPLPLSSNGSTAKRSNSLPGGGGKHVGGGGGKHSPEGKMSVSKSVATIPSPTAPILPQIAGATGSPARRA